MRYTSPSQKVFVENRKRLAKELPAGSMAVFNANDRMPTNADGTMGFRQNNDLFYLTGVDQEETLLVFYPDAPNPEWREMLFIRETSELIAIWEGAKLTKEKATAVSGVKSVHWLSQFPVFFHQLMCQCGPVYLNTNEHPRAVIEVETRDARFVRRCREDYPLHEYRRIAPLMHKLRAVKSREEIELIKAAAGITAKGFRRVLGYIRPGVKEYEIEAEFAHEFIRNRSRGFAYSPIVATGANACVLHYIENDATCRDGDVVLMDVAAEYANYASDVTRAIPVNGRFTKRQRQVYEAVLRVQRAAMKMLVPGNVLDSYQKEVAKVMEKELIGLGLLKAADVKKQDLKKPLYRKYFMHGTSHHLGLDVHDLGDRFRPFEEGMVYTCEPGIYIRQEKLGVRLEDDVLVTKKGPVILSSAVPVEPDEIEELMNGGNGKPRRRKK